jgi:hypothetical protein
MAGPESAPARLCGAVRGHWARMANAALPGDDDTGVGWALFGDPPPMPSIAASALDETRELVASLRRGLAALLARG